MELEKYHKIQSIYKRDPKTNRFIIGEWATPELELLQNIIWEFTEKVNGTNIRIHWDGDLVRKFGGRTDAAQIPAHLYEALEKIFTIENLNSVPPVDENEIIPINFYGEGYGHKIQSGEKYIGREVDFVLFDVKIGVWWLKREAVNNIAYKLKIKSVPVIGEGTLHDAIKIVKGGLKSVWGDFEAEGIVARPKIDLFARNGHKIITKIKAKDFK